MRVKAVFFARVRQAAGVDSLLLEVPVDSTVRNVADLLTSERGLNLAGCMVAVNETYAAPDQVLSDGDELAFLPPVSGGGEPWCHAEVTDKPLTLEVAAAFLVRPEFGAQAYFVGTVRSPNAGKQVLSITYEGFQPMALKVLHEAAERAAQQFGSMRAFLQHRLGCLEPGEASIVIGVATPHRRAALGACDFLIEELKRTLPIWKDELDEDGRHWVDGQTPHATL